MVIKPKSSLIYLKFFGVSIIILLFTCFILESHVLAATAYDGNLAFTDDVYYEIEDTKPEMGITEGQPFATGTGGSKYFRIPAFSVMEDGTYVCAADARWDDVPDGGGSDTILSISENEGESWTYSFPFYFGDSYHSLAKHSEMTTIIDPELVVKGNTIYLFADIFPTGIMSSGIFPSVGTGYVSINGIKRLMLTDDYANTSINPINAEQYPYYIGDFSDYGYAPILKRENGDATKYYVDEFYNIYELAERGLIALGQKQVDSDRMVKQNIFYRDSIFHVYNTSYLCVARSDNKGKSWKYDILNPQVKNDKDALFMTSPGNGLVLKDGTIVVNVWERPSLLNDRSGLLYSSDNGATWKRMESLGIYSNENRIIELQDGTLRMFYRYDPQTDGMISYVDMYEENGIYKQKEVTKSKLKADVGCNFSVLSYSKTIGGKQVILISCPGEYSRKKGIIFLCQIEKDNSISLLNEYVVTEGRFYYSAMDELQDGSIGLLYEKASGVLDFIKIGIGEIAGGIQFDDETPDTQESTHDLPKEGTVFKHGKDYYKVIKAGLTVSFLRTLRKSNKITIPASVKIAGINYKVTSIGVNALKSNKRIKTVVIGKNVRKIGKTVFKNCIRLENIVIKSAELTSIGKNALKGIKSTATIQVPNKRLNAYTKLIKGKGQSVKVKIIKWRG